MQEVLPAMALVVVQEYDASRPISEQTMVRRKYCAIGLLQSSRVGKKQTMLRLGERSDEGERVRAGSV